MNAGVISIAPISEVKVEELDRMIGVNIKEVLYGITAGFFIFQKQNSEVFKLPSNKF